MTGAIAVFSTTQDCNTQSTLRSLIEMIRPNALLSASRCTDRRWQEAMSGELAEDDFEALSSTVSLERCLKLVHRTKCVGVLLGDSALLQQCAMDVATIKEDVRGDFSVSSIFVSVGAHDLFEAVAEPKLFGRAYASVQVTGYGSPNDWPEARRQIAALPSVKRLEELCRPILGEVQTCVFWDG